MEILGEKYDEMYGFECDQFDPYDPFGEEPEDYPEPWEFEDEEA